MKESGASGRVAITRRDLVLGVGAVLGVSACTQTAQQPISNINSSTAGIQMTKPTIVLVHGFWGGAAHWSKVIVELTKLGYGSIHAVENPLSSLADDVARTRKMLAQQKGPVVLVGHSYGGVVITEAGTHPNVAALVYIAAFCPRRGRELGGCLQGLSCVGFGERCAR